MDRRRRQHALLALLAQRPWPVEGLMQELQRQAGSSEGLSKRSLEADIADLRTQLGEDVLLRRTAAQLDEVPRAWAGHRVFWCLAPGQEPVPVTGELTALSEDAVLALELARAALRTPQPQGADTPLNPLAAALDRVLARLGVLSAGEGRRRARERASFSAFGSEGCDPAVMRAVLAALRDGADLRFRYTAIGKAARTCAVRPVRLLYADHDWFLWAWEDDGRSGDAPKLWKLARMADCAPTRLRAQPLALSQQADDAESLMFRSTCQQPPTRVVAVFAATAWPHVRGRTWGRSQRVEELPDGRWRLSFVTGGIEAAKHWLLQFGALVQVEQPVAVRAWLQEQAQRIAALEPGR